MKENNRKKTIYLILEGRIGNQMFMYAAARAFQKYNNDEIDLVIDDSCVRKLKWENSLIKYDLDNVTYVHSKKELIKYKLSFSYIIWFFYFHFGIRILNYRQRFEFEKKHQVFFRKHNIILCENGYLPMERNIKSNILMRGYYQSEKYFDIVKDEIINKFRIEDKVSKSDYPNLDKIKFCNSVCISIKVEHNAGNKMYDVCNRKYWEKAIKYIIDNVENPLFFICSDNVEYVLEHYIDKEKYDAVFQSRDYPVDISLGVMSCCKHFIIGNTSFGWWAQYLSSYKDKIVVAPSRWYGIDVPCDIYQDNWVLIDV